MKSKQAVTYSVKPQDRIRAILGDDYVLTEEDTLSYSWSGGYEKLEVQHEHDGALKYASAYHPSDGACEGNPCWHCGKAFYE